MLFHLISLTLVIILIFLTNLSLSNPGNDLNRLGESPQYRLPICVVGAGVSGLNVASLLEQKGYPVEVFEKNGIIGGKVKTYRIPGQIQVEMCPLLFSTDHSDLLLEKLRQFQLSTVPFGRPDYSEFNPRTGELYSPPIITSSQKNAMIEAVQSYGYCRNVIYKRDLESYGNLNVSSELFVPMSTWLKAHRLEAIRFIFELLVTVEGYGHLDDVPALYVLRLVDESIVEGVAKGTSGESFSVKEGLDVLVDRMASTLQSVYVNTEVVRIERGGNTGVRIVFQNNYERICEKVILAFPPLLPNLARLIVDLRNWERAILDQVKIHKYVSGANYIPTLNQTLYFERGPLSGNGGVTAFVKQSPLRQQNVYSSYSWIRGEFDRTATNDELWNINQQLSSTIQRMSNNQGGTYRLQSSEYFPHVNTQALQRGFYQAFDNLQGVGGIYYATTLLEFELIEAAFRMTQGFVQRFF